jgi:prepilin-type processing-associated H-X9-DG protein
MKKVIGLTFGLLFFVSNANAVDLGVAAKVGLNGVGVDLSVALTKTINARLSVASIDVDGEDETVTVGDPGFEGDVAADLNFDYGANALFFDWHVFDGSFRLSAGMYKNNGAADLSGTLLGPIRVDGQDLFPTDIGVISGELSLGESYQPYIGIGWGRGAGGGGGFSLSVDIGVALVEAGVSFEATLTPAGIGNFPGGQAQLDQTLTDLEDDAEEDLDDLEFWPVLAIGLNYAF